MGYQTGTLRGKNPCSKVGTPSEGNFTTESFDSYWLIEKESIGKFVLPSPSGGNPISEAYMHSPPSGKNSMSEGLTPSGGNPSNGAILSGEITSAERGSRSSPSGGYPISGASYLEGLQ